LDKPPANFKVSVHPPQNSAILASPGGLPSQSGLTQGAPPRQPASPRDEDGSNPFPPGRLEAGRERRQGYAESLTMPSVRPAGPVTGQGPSPGLSSSRPTTWTPLGTAVPWPRGIFPCPPQTAPPASALFPSARPGRFHGGSPPLRPSAGRGPGRRFPRRRRGQGLSSRRPQPLPQASPGCGPASRGWPQRASGPRSAGGRPESSGPFPSGLPAMSGLQGLIPTQKGMKVTSQRRGQSVHPKKGFRASPQY
jgi:hypothetical protein